MIAIQTSSKKIAVIDDDKILAETTAWEVEEAGYQPYLLVDGNFHDVNELASRIIENSQGAVCDHRLLGSGFANFFGAELVAALYDRKFPSLLITQFTEMDTSLSIRKWRHKIPVLLSRDLADASNIAKGIEDCRAELDGQISNIRKSYRTIVRIDSSNVDSVEAFIPGWNPHKAIRFPTSLIPANIRQLLKPDLRLFAHVNIGAEESDDIYFKKFELAPEPDENDGLT